MTYISFTRQDLSQALIDATQAARSPRQLDRIAQATTFLWSWGGSAWTLKTDTLTIHSRSSDAVYTLTLGAFMVHVCPSRRPCWHETLGSLIMAANQIRADREALEYVVWSPNQPCCGGQGCPSCMLLVEPAVTLAQAAVDALF